MKESIIFEFELDGDQWCCHLVNFINFEESPAGFGNTRKEALESFLEMFGDHL
jgi:hypothetical protein